MSKTKLALKLIPSNIPQQYIDADGRLYFDLPSGFDIELSNVATKVTLNGFAEVAALGFTLPSTLKNDLILSLYKTPNIYNQDQNKGIEINVISGAVTLPQTYLQIKSYSKQDKEYECELTYSDDDVLFGLKNTLMSDLMAQPFTLDYDEMDNYYWNLSGYDGDSDLCYPLINYGRFYYLADGDNRLRVHINEFRPHLFTAAIFKKAFCGLKLKGEFLNSDLWLKNISYLLRTDYDKVLLEKRKFLASCDTITAGDPFGTLTGTFPLVVDNGLYPNTFGVDFNNTTNSWGVNRHGVYGFTFNCTFTDASGGLGNLVVGIYKNGVELLGEAGTVVSGSTISATCDAVELKPSDYVVVKWRTEVPSPDVIYISDISFVNTPIKDCTPYETETDLNLRSFIDPTLTVFDYVQAVSSEAMFNLRYSLNRATSEITIYSESAKTVFGDAVTPLIEPTRLTLDWYSKTVKDSLEINYKQSTDTLKDINVKWKSSTDAYINDILKPERELFSYYELVNGNGNKSVNYENPLFEPTATARWWLVTDTDGLVFEPVLTGMPYISIMADNQDNRHSYEVGFRTLQLSGRAVQLVNDDTIIAQFDFMSEIYTIPTGDTAFSFATMYYNGNFITGAPNTNLTFDKLPLNLYNQLLQANILRNSNGIEIQCDLILDREDFFNYDFTNLVAIEFENNVIVVMPTKLDGFSLNTKQPVRLTAQIYKDLCP